MLTPEQIKEVKVLSELTDDQITAVVNLSGVDDKAVSDEATSTAYGNVDKVMKEITGEEKPHGTLTSVYVKAQIEKLKKSTGQFDKTELEKEITKLKADNEKLKVEADKGKDAAGLTRQIADKEQQITDLQDKVKTIEADKETIAKEKEEELALYKEEIHFSKALSGLTFVSEDIVAKETREFTINAIKDAIRAKYDREFVDDELVFRDKKTGTIINDKDNLAKPMTADKLMSTMLGGLVDKGRQAAGGGADKKDQNDKRDIIDVNGISSAKTQNEAGTIIRKYLGQKGVPAGTEEYRDQQTKLWADHKISDLPIQ